MKMALDAVVVLANLMNAKGELNAESMERAAKAANIFKTEQAGFIITCGWAYREDCDITIADAFAHHLAKRHAVPLEKIITETSSRDTVGDAFFTLTNVILPHQWKNIAVVTSGYHLGRTREIFTFIYGRHCGLRFEPADNRVDPALERSEVASMGAFRSTFAEVEPGDLDKIYNRLLTRHPFYNGDVYPRLPEAHGSNGLKPGPFVSPN